ncbi:MAG: hypothetical protein IJK52_10600 [Oscillospiraceae bacterium]|nr:hypothetical protein [Oscillospiraceae bacterium]
MSDRERIKAQKLADMCETLEPEQLRILLTYIEGFLAARDHFAPLSVAESRPAER